MNASKPVAAPIAYSATTSATTPRTNFSPRAAVAFSFLDSIHWLRSKLQALVTHTAQAYAAVLTQPHYHPR